MKSINEYIIQFDKTHFDTTMIGEIEMNVNPYFEQPEWINRIGKVVSTPILSPENAVIKSGHEVIVIHTSLLHESYKTTGRKESFFCVDIEKNLFRFEDNLIVMYRENSSQEWKCNGLNIMVYATTEGITMPDESTLRKANNLLVALKTAGIWAKLDIFSNFAYNDTDADEFSLICWKRLTEMTINGGVSYTNTGFKGNGVDGYIDTLYNPATYGGNYILNDASFGAIVNEEGASGSPIFGTSGVRNRIRSVDAADHRINESGSNLNLAYDFSGTGLKLINRDDATNVRCISGSDEGARTQASASIESTNQILFRGGALYGDINISMAMMGASLTYTESQTFRTIYNNYLTSIGLSAIA